MGAACGIHQSQSSVDQLLSGGDQLQIAVAPGTVGVAGVVQGGFKARNHRVAQHRECLDGMTAVLPGLEQGRARRDARCLRVELRRLLARAGRRKLSLRSLTGEKRDAEPGNQAGAVAALQPADTGAPAQIAASIRLRQPQGRGLNALLTGELKQVGVLRQRLHQRLEGTGAARMKQRVVIHAIKVRLLGAPQRGELDAHGRNLVLDMPDLQAGACGCGLRAPQFRLRSASPFHPLGDGLLGLASEFFGALGNDQLLLQCRQINEQSGRFGLRVEKLGAALCGNQCLPGIDDCDARGRAITELDDARQRQGQLDAVDASCFVGPTELIGFSTQFQWRLEGGGRALASHGFQARRKGRQRRVVVGDPADGFIEGQRCGGLRLCVARKQPGKPDGAKRQSAESS